MENRYVSTGFLTSELVCSVSGFSRFVPDLLAEKEEEDGWGLGLTDTSRADRHAVEGGIIYTFSGNQTTILQ